MTRSPEPRLQEYDAPIVDQVGVWTGDAVRVTFMNPNHPYLLKFCL